LVRGELRWPTVAVGDLAGRSVLHTRPFGKHLLTRQDDGRTLLG
jgi:endonuclease-8